MFPHGILCIFGKRIDIYQYVASSMIGLGAGFFRFFLTEIRSYNYDYK